MGNDLIEVCLGIGALVFFVCIFLATWASSEVNWRMHCIHLNGSDESGLFGHPPLNRTPLASWTLFHLPIFILTGRYRDWDDPKVRRYGAIARYAMIVWYGGVTAFLMFVAGCLVAAKF